MNPLVELAVDLVEKSIDVVVKIINDSKEHSEEEKAALIEGLKLRLDVKCAQVAAVVFKNV